MYRKTTLDNGLRVLTSTNPHSPSVSVAVFMAAGPKYERAELAGISHFVEHLLFKGTRRWPSSKDVSEVIDRVGGLLNGGTDKEATVYWSKVAHTHFQLALDVLTELLRYPKMDPADTEQERSVIIEEINMCFDSPQHRVDTLADQLAWPDQPLGWDIAGTKETVSAITHQDITGYMGQRYLPNNAVVAAAGNVIHDNVLESAKRAFDGWKPAESPSGFPADNRQTSPRLLIEHRGTEQVNLCMGIRGMPATDPDRFAFDLISAILGEGMSSRLFIEVREKKGLAYDIHSSATHYTDSGLLNVYAGVDPGRVNDAIAAILEQLAWAKDSVPESELEKAREMSKGRLLLRMEDTRHVVSWLGSQELITGKILSPEDVIAQVDRITLDDIKRVGRKYLSGDKVSLAIVGPVKESAVTPDMLKL